MVVSPGMMSFDSLGDFFLASIIRNCLIISGGI